MHRSRRAFVASAGALLGGCLAPAGPGRDVACPAPAGEGDARIGFVGDVMLGRNVDDRWGDPARGPAGVWDGMLDYLEGLDGLVCNLECCLSDRGTPRDRVYTFRADPDWAVPALRAGGVDAVSLANNHVLDFGPPAFADTLASLDAGGIGHAGAGQDLAAALAPAHVRIGDVDVAVIGLTDRYPAYAASPRDRGTAYAPLAVGDPMTRELVDRALERALAGDPDLVVASLHWGPNWEVRPDGEQQRFARWLVDRGVDVVHGHSAHVVQGVEVYRGRPIVYDAGDFVDDYVVKDDLHNDRSYCFEVEIRAGTLTALRLVPVEIDRSSVPPASDAAAAWLRDRLRTLSGAFDTTVTREGPGLRIPLSACEDAETD